MTAALAEAPEIIGIVRRLAPSTQVDVRHYDFDRPDAGLLGGDSDIAIVCPPFIGLNPLRTTLLKREPRYVVLAAFHRLAGRSTLSFADFESEPWIGPDTDPSSARSGDCSIGAASRSS